MARPTGNLQAGAATEAMEPGTPAANLPEGTPTVDVSAPRKPAMRRFHCPGSASFKLLYQPPIEASPPIPGMPYQSTGRPGTYIEFANNFYSTDDPDKIRFIEHATQSGMPLYIDGVKGVIRDALAEAESNLAMLEQNVEAYKAMIRAGKPILPGQTILQGVSFAGQDFSPRPVSLMSPVSVPAGPGTDWNPQLK